VPKLVQLDYTNSAKVEALLLHDPFGKLFRPVYNFFHAASKALLFHVTHQEFLWEKIYIFVS